MRYWEPVVHTLEFKHLAGPHTGDDIRVAFEAELLERRISAAQIGCIVCDSASNMIKAFNMNVLFNEVWHMEHTDRRARTDELLNAVMNEQLDLSVPDVKPCRRIRCCAHTLQLAVNSAIKKDLAATELLRLLRVIINIFRRSNA